MAKSTDKDRARASALKEQDVERVTGRCAQCYKIITVDSRKSRFTHMCR